MLRGRKVEYFWTPEDGLIYDRASSEFERHRKKLVEALDGLAASMKLLSRIDLDEEWDEAALMRSKRWKDTYDYLNPMFDDFYYMHSLRNKILGEDLDF